MKKVLLIGINYVGSSSQLMGCINDVTNMYNFLNSKYDLDPNNVHILTDNTEEKPNKKNILKELQWLASNNKPGDSLFLHYAGHGSHIHDFSNDEDDGRDEVLVPLDYRTAGLIVDDQLRKILVEPLLNNVQLFCVFDCCHSGTMLDVRHKYEMINDSFVDSKNDKYANTLAKVTTISGCKDNQTSADTREENSETGKMQFQGALTCTLLKLMKAYDCNISLKDLIVNLNIELKNKGYKQRPVLCTGYKQDIKLPSLNLLSDH